MNKEYAYFGEHHKDQLEPMGEHAKQIVLSTYVRQCMADPAWSEFKDGVILAGASFDLKPNK